MSAAGPEQAAHGAEADAAFAQWMNEVDLLQDLRQRDPAAALSAVLSRRGRWPALPAGHDALLQARCALQAGTARMMLGDLAPARADLDDVERWLAAPALVSAPDALRHQARRCGIAAANAKAALAHGQGDLASALRAYLQALDLARSIGEQRFEAHLLTNVATTFEESGLPTEALEHARQALALAQALDLQELQGDIHHNIGNALAASGHLKQGLAANEHALGIYQGLGLAQKQGYALVAVAERLLQLGRFAQASQALDRRALLQGDFVNRAYEAHTAYLRGRIAAARGDVDAARQAYLQALDLHAGDLGDVVGQARSRLELARLDADHGMLDEARTQALGALALLQGSHALPELMRVHQLLSRIAKAQGDAARALHHHEAFHAGYAQCHDETSARRASVLAVRHQVDLARAEAQRQRLENARLTEALAEIAARLPARSAGTPADRDRPARPAQPRDLQALGLTPREAEVLFWVAKGKTNDDVALLLGSSLSAVKKHLARVYEKLGVENRTAAASAARRLIA